MRIQLVKGAEVDETGLVELTANYIKGQLEQRAEHTLVDENPDVLHVVGALERTSMAVIRQQRKRHIAFVYTPVTALTPWNTPSSASVKMAREANILVSSGEMEHTLLEGKTNQEQRLIKTTVSTATTTDEEMMTAYNEIYSKAYAINEAELQKVVKEKIALLNEENTTITNLCEKLLYAQLLYQRRNIPLRYLQELTEYMTDNDYDEDRLASLLQLLQLDLFTQQLEYVMKEQTGLTEGFMPIIWKEDKTSKDILTTLTNY